MRQEAENLEEVKSFGVKAMKTLDQPLRCGMIILVLWVLFSVRPASAHLPIPPFPYQEQGLFVQVPAVIGGIVFAVPGAVVGSVVCLFYPDNLAPGLLKTLGECGAVGGLLSSMAGSAMLGLPFYVVKKFFWDFPRWLLGIDRSLAITEPPQPFEEPRLPERTPDAASSIKRGRVTSK